MNGYRSFNPFYMRYSTDPRGIHLYLHPLLSTLSSWFYLFLFTNLSQTGNFAGQHGYGVLSIFAYVDAALQVNAGTPAADLNDGQLATMATTVVLTAVSFIYLSSFILFSSPFPPLLVLPLAPILGRSPVRIPLNPLFFLRGVVAGSSPALPVFF